VINSKISPSVPVINENNLLRYLQELISIQSDNPSLVSGGSGEEKIGQYLYHCLKKLGLKTFKQSVTPKRSNIIGILKGKGNGKNLLLNGHMDTVGISGMEIDPLRAELKEGRIYGRGSADMKGGIAAMISACEAIQTAGIEPKGDVLVTMVVDEEHKSIGTENLLEDYTADAAIVCEPTDLKIGVAHKGFVWGEVGVFGKAAHGSRPEEGIDAIMQAGKLLVEIERFAQTELQAKKHPLLGPPSLHASLIKGGRELSTYPDTCTIQLERRTIPGEDHHVFERELHKTIKKIHRKDGQFRATYECLFHRPPFEISEKQEIVKIISRCYEYVIKRKSEFAGISWWMDSALFAQAGIPTLAFGPAGTGLHGPIESVNFTSVIQTASVLANTIIDFCGI
jgi:acetylornithine deacetylase